MTDRNPSVPQHIAIIMDGNGRWAQERHLPRTLGHREGVLRVKEIVQAAVDLHIEVVTLFAFSTENWTRPSVEVKTLMHLLSVYLGRVIANLSKKNIRLRFIGRRDPLPKVVLNTIERAEKKTRDNTGLTLVLAVNYGARQEIIDGIKAMLKDCEKGTLQADTVDEEAVGSYLYTAGLPDPDLLIRTSGEQRISNFLLWQLSYAELYFPRKYWPDFKKADLLEALDVYAKRVRKFGGIETKGKV
jgi:undecaprenyl diphosphate synthase